MMPNTKHTAICLPALLAMILVVGVACSPAGAPAEETAYAELIDERGGPVANAEFSETDAGVKMQLRVTNLQPGTYTAQVHEVGVCDGPGFLSAGAPFPPAEEIAMVEGNTGAGNRCVAQFQVTGGATEVDAVIPVVTLRPGNNSLFHPGGTALIIDDMSPAGVYEGRVACGIITKTPQHVVEDLTQGDIESARQPDSLGTPGKEYQRPQAEQ